jgi:CRISPR-associated endonuclease/helicase Cas3
MSSWSFDDFFKKAAGKSPFPFQRQFAEAVSIPEIVCVPTGLGKTAMAVLGWLWRRFGGDEQLKRTTPRRLVYCLPMRVLVEQTRDSALDWLDAMGLLAGSIEREPQKDGRRGRVRTETYKWVSGAVDRVGVHVLMGGEEVEEWDIHPEREAIIIGTQDMLVSRALNRGYAASRSRWPIQFGLLNTDCLWIFDEIQLMGAALATTAQLEAFRRTLPREVAEQAKNGHGCRSVWMSATMKKDWLGTVDFKPFLERATELTFDFQKEANADGLDEGTREILENRWKAPKPLKPAKAVVGETDKLAREILAAHKPGMRTIVVVNTVRRARELYDTIAKLKWGSSDDERLILLHSRFRPGDRENAVKGALAHPPSKGTIVVSTQVIEAGVDVSAATLFTELAPWASLVQRFGRCNRRGEDNEGAQVFWIDLPAKRADAEKMVPPYESDDLHASAERLKQLTDVGLRSLPEVELSYQHIHVIRRKDLIDLFDTTPDLAGNDIDIDRFVRDTEASDVRVFWREWDGDKPPQDKAWRRVWRGEFCSAPIGSKQTDGFAHFAHEHRGKVWRWDYLNGQWSRPDVIYPGQVYLVRIDAGGYSPQRGWGDDGDFEVLGPRQAVALSDDEYDDDGLSKTDRWQTIAEHTDEVCGQIDSVLKAVAAASGLGESECDALLIAARWHDWGKAHDTFQIKVDDGQDLLTGRRSQDNVRRRQQRPAEWANCRVVGKAPGERKGREGTVAHPGFWSRIGVRDGGRKYFRHELVSALAVLQRPHDSLRFLNDEFLALVAYLVASHHGKVRLSIRSLPKESRPRDNKGKPQPERRFARGVWDGDDLPATELGGGMMASHVTLSLEPMELGLCEEQPFAGQPSWSERMLRLRDRIGPFRLAYLEAILRAADMRASKAAGRRDAAATRENAHA